MAQVITDNTYSKFGRCARLRLGQCTMLTGTYQNSRYCNLLDDDLRDVLVVVGERIHAEFSLLTEHVLRASTARNAPKDYAIEKRVSTKAVVTVNAACCLASNEKTRQRLAVLYNLAIWSSQNTTHAIMNDWSDDGHVKWLF